VFRSFSVEHHVHSLWSLLPSGLAVVVTRSKQSRVFNEELRILVVCAVIGVGVDDQLRVTRMFLLHDERVHRGHDHVVTAFTTSVGLLMSSDSRRTPFAGRPTCPSLPSGRRDTLSFTSGSRPT